MTAAHLKATPLIASGVSVMLGGRSVVDAVSLDLRPGEVTAIIGPNGAGKSTLLTALAGLRKPQAGAVTLGERALADLPDRTRAQRIGFLPQSPEIAWAVDVETLVGLGRSPWRGAFSGDLGSEDRAIVARALQATHLEAFAHRIAQTLSGGERARALIARVLAGEPEWLLADEPLTGLDPGHQFDACALLRGVADEGRGVAITLHDLALAGRFADRVVVLRDGRIVTDAPPAEALTAGLLAEVYGVEATVSRDGDGLAIAMHGRISGGSAAVTEARLALGALLLEAAVGYPDTLHRKLPHPVVGVGRAIDALERRWNRPARPDGERRLLGVAALALIGSGAALAGGLAGRRLRPRGRTGAAALTLLATVGLAQRSLYQHVRAVQRALDHCDLPAARAAVSRIVGRDTDALDKAGVAAAALESLAESFNDGVVAPAFWLAVAGLPGLAAYKAVNTADSLIGHREPRWNSFGWASARADDAMNLAPARLAGSLLCAAGGGGWIIMARDAGTHASPNAGWPEAAMAGALGVRLGGPATYDGELTQRPTFGDGPPPGGADLGRGVDLYLRACGLLWLVMGAAAWRR